MKIAISTNGTELSSQVAPLTGTGVSFIVYGPNNYSYTLLDEEFSGDRDRHNYDGWVDLIAEAGIDVLVVGGITFENAYQLGCSGVRIYECVSATVWEAIQALKLNLLQAMDVCSDGSDPWKAVQD